MNWPELGTRKCTHFCSFSRAESEELILDVMIFGYVLYLVHIGSILCYNHLNNNYKKWEKKQCSIRWLIATKFSQLKLLSSHYFSCILHATAGCKKEPLSTYKYSQTFVIIIVYRMSWFFFIFSIRLVCYRIFIYS